MLGLSACGDDGGDNGSGGDAGEECDPVHNPCDGGTGDGGGEETLSFETPEGGFVLFEYINASDALAPLLGLPDGVTTVSRVIANFMNNMDPQAAPPPVVGGCVDLTRTGNWPMGQGADREYLDVGTLTIDGPDTAGEAVSFEVPMATDANTPTFPNDDINRTHDIFYQIKSPPAYQQADSLYSVTLGGAGDIPEHTYEDALYMPADFEMTPGLNEEVPMTAGEDLVLSWTPADNSNSPITEVPGGAFFISILASPNTGEPVIFCVAPSDAGTFTIPGEMISNYVEDLTANGEANPNVALLLRQQTAHILDWFENGDEANRRRMDFLGVWCNVQIVQIAEP